MMKKRKTERDGYEKSVEEREYQEKETQGGRCLTDIRGRERGGEQRRERTQIKV